MAVLVWGVRASGDWERPRRATRSRLDRHTHRSGDEVPLRVEAEAEALTWEAGLNHPSMASLVSFHRAQTNNIVRIEIRQL